MKRCPKCNQVFDQEWLSFCTNDGTSLVDTSALPPEPPPTMMSPPLPPSVSPSEQPTINLQTGSSQPPPAPYSPPAPMQQSWPPPSQPMQAGWQPPPPPAYVKSKKQGFAIASLILGILSFPGTCLCYVGGIPMSLAAIIFGSVSLVQIKNDPVNNTGKPLALTGVILGAAYLAFCIVIVLIYGVAIFTANLK